MTRVIGRQPQHASRLRVPPGGVLLRGDGGCGARGEQREQEGSDAHHSLVVLHRLHGGRESRWIQPRNGCRDEQRE